LLNAAGLAAFLAVGLPAGAWVDRWLKRRTMISADLLRMAAMAAVPLLWWSGGLEIWHLYLVAGIVGTATVFFDVAYQSYVPVLVASPQVSEANSKLEATAQIARIGGPAAGGALLAVVSAPCSSWVRPRGTCSPRCSLPARATQRRVCRRPHGAPFRSKYGKASRSLSGIRSSAASRPAPAE
jgi:MFS family permease